MKNKLFANASVFEIVTTVVAILAALSLLLFIYLAITTGDEDLKEFYSYAALYNLVGNYPIGMLAVVGRLTRKKPDSE